MAWPAGLGMRQPGPLAQGPSQARQPNPQGQPSGAAYQPVTLPSRASVKRSLAEGGE